MKKKKKEQKVSPWLRRYLSTTANAGVPEEEALDALRSAIIWLRPREENIFRRAVGLDVQQQSSKEIAAIYGLSVGRVRNLRSHLSQRALGLVLLQTIPISEFSTAPEPDAHIKETPSE